MTHSSAPAADLFGTNLVAAVTPMTPDGALDELSLVALVDHLLATRCDGIVVAGTSGESPTLTSDELRRTVRAVVSRVSGRARVTVGVGTYDTAETIRRARAAEADGADGLLLVAPYYSRTTEAGLIAHCRAVADATALPVMLYDVPARSGIAFSPAALTALAAHPRIRAIKDARGDLFDAMDVMHRTGLAHYCGIDELNLPYLAAGATGLVSVIGNVAADRNAELIDAVRRGDLVTARRVNAAAAPLTTAIMRTAPGAVMAKAALARLGIIGDDAVRLPLVPPDPAHLAVLDAALRDGLVREPAAAI